MRRGPFAILASLLVAIVFAGANLASDKWLAPVRLDFTGSHLYTLSSSARTVIGRLVEPIDLELVLARNVASNYPTVRAHADRVRELLAEIAAKSNGKIRIRETDPAPFSEDEDRVTAAGLTPAPSDGGDPLYFGLIGRNSVDDAIAIPYLTPERDAMLEYDLVRLIAQLDDPAPAKVAVISSLPAYEGDGKGEGDALILREMARAYQVVPVERDFTQLPPGTDVLVIVHPPKLNDWQVYQIDQFLLRKGRALIAVDPVSRVALTSRGAHAAMSSSLDGLMMTLGVTESSSEVAADRVLALPVNVDAGEGRREVQGQPLFMAVRPALMSAKDLVTGDLKRPVNFGLAGRLVRLSSLKATFTPLIETTPDAALFPAAMAAQGPSPREVSARYQPVGERLTLAARLSGNLSTAFRVGPPAVPASGDAAADAAARTAAANAPPRVTQSQTPAEVILIADTDVFDDAFYVNPQGGAPLADNAAFVLNALDNLSGDEALVKLRSRSPAARPMKRVDDLRQSANQRLYREQARLERQLSDTQARLSQLQAARKAADEAGGQRLKRTTDDAGEIDAFRKQVSDLRSRLRAVQRDFRRDIDRLAGRLELLNVWLPPLFIALLGLGVFGWRSRRGSRRS